MHENLFQEKSVQAILNERHSYHTILAAYTFDVCRYVLKHLSHWTSYSAKQSSECVEELVLVAILSF